MPLTISGQQTVTIAGSAERLHADLVVNGPVRLQALPGNGDVIYVGQEDGDVGVASGLPLGPGEGVSLMRVGNLREVYVDAVSDGDGVAWMLLEV